MTEATVRAVEKTVPFARFLATVAYHDIHKRHEAEKRILRMAEAYYQLHPEEARRV